MPTPKPEETRKQDLPMQTRAAAFAPGSINENDRTIELVWSTGATVRRKDWYNGRVYDEELSLDPAHVDLSRLNNGAPLLNTHRSYELEGVVGVVESASIKNGEGHAVVRFSERDEVAGLWNDVRAGIIRNVSIGYAVRAFECIEEDGKVEIRRAIDWQPSEISLVPVGADADAGTRSDKEKMSPCEFINRASAHNQEVVMPKKTEETAADAATRAAEEEKTRAAAVAAAAAAPVEPTTKTVDADALRAEGQTAERTRQSDIHTAARNLGIEGEVVDKLITDGTSADAARTALIDHHADTANAGQAISGTVRDHNHQDNTDPKVMATRMGEAAACRYTGETPAEEASQYVGLSMTDMARDLLDVAGVSTRGLRSHEIIERAMASSDLPILLTETGDRMLLPGYQKTPSTFKRIAKQTTNRDFRAKSMIRDGDFPTLLPLNEHGELKQGSLSESKETIQLSTVGRRLALTREMLINDDLGYFADLAFKAGQASALYENTAAWSVITTNADMADGTALFHADHGNLAGSGAAISVTSVGARKSAMRTQTNQDGNTLNYTPALLVVPSAKEAVAEQYLSDLVIPTKASDAVPASHKQLELLVEPLLDADSATAWYMFANPELLAALVYAYLEGREGPQLARRETTTVLGIEFDVLLDTAVAAVEHRAAQKNPGA